MSYIKEDYKPSRRGRGLPTVEYLKRNWITVGLAAWACLSAYPAFLYYTGFPLQKAAPRPTSQPHQPRKTVTETVVMPSIGPTALPGALPPNPPEDAFRITDATDAFKDWPQREDCQLSSLELHGPFEPLCENKEDLLTAMNWGGRIGFDAPYSPRGCDMRWFNTPEICEILSRFDRINIVGDSIMRNMAVAVQIFLRQDLLNGGKASWDVDPAGHDCSCAGVFEDRACAFNGVVSNSMVYMFDPTSTICPEETTAAIEYFHVLDYPIADEDIEVLQRFQSPDKPTKPVANILGHGLWNDLAPEKTYAWIWQVLNATTEASPWLKEERALNPRLFMTPNAAGDKKPDIFLARQGNVALSRFEKTVGAWVRAHGMDFLGTFNATIQTNNPDGTHGGMRNNLLKAMMVFNWLNSIDVTLHDQE